MTTKELRRLNRRELLELLVEQSRAAEELQRQVERLQEQLDSRKLALAEAGSIAEAALRMNHIFEDAQAAAQQYLDNVRDLPADQERRCREMIAETEARCAAMEEETRQTCRRLLAQAQKGIGEQTGTAEE